MGYPSKILQKAISLLASLSRVHFLQYLEFIEVEY